MPVSRCRQYFNSMTGTVQQQIISELGVRPVIDPAAQVRLRVDFLKNYLLASGPAAGFVLGISGGQDSTLAGKLAQIAVSELRADGVPATFYALRLPYGVQRDEADAQLALSFIEPDRLLTIDIKPAVDAAQLGVNQAFTASALQLSISDFNKGNMKARQRMLVQYAVAGQTGALVIGTDHAAEAVTGFFTKHGDGACDLVPLAGLNKSQGAQLLQYLDAPERLWRKEPTADLLDSEPGRSDATELGISYPEIDAYLRGEVVSTAVRENLERRFQGSKHKRQLPPGPESTWWKE